jgi:UDP-glucose 4-epimerase
MKAVVTGGAGFIGSHLVERLIEDGDDVTVIDKTEGNISNYVIDKDIEFIKSDILDIGSLKKNLSNADIVFHLAAVSDVRSGIENKLFMFEQNVTATMNLLEIAQECGVGGFVFFSSQAIYGNVVGRITEDTLPKPVSLYGATKLAGEHLVSFYPELGMRSYIFRIANVVGPRQSHGVIVDFIEKLRKDGNKLEILGDGKQEKSYVHVDDCIGAILYSVKMSKGNLNIFNVGSGNTLTVNEIAEIVADAMDTDPEFVYTGGRIGWPGDIALSSLSIGKLESLGWRPRYTSRKAVEEAVKALIQ